ncbi:hypothetical protein [Streptomyces incarnatus]|uniref:hypothetical protein n=1 Tax=Streptomyces incarnatus TaxID=665007 RepID=UPI001AD848D9
MTDALEHVLMESVQPIGGEGSGAAGECVPLFGARVLEHDVGPSSGVPRRGHGQLAGDDSDLVGHGASRPGLHRVDESLRDLLGAVVVHEAPPLSSHRVIIRIQSLTALTQQPGSNFFTVRRSW